MCKYFYNFLKHKVSRSWENSNFIAFSEKSFDLRFWKNFVVKLLFIQQISDLTSRGLSKRDDSQNNLEFHIMGVAELEHYISKSVKNGVKNVYIDTEIKAFKK